jgi:putative thiamine transport system ATP-binding protein
MSRVLSLRDVTLTVAGRLLLGPLSLDISAGLPTTLMGPSGSGKSSLLAWLTGSLSPDFTVTGQAFLGKTRIDRLAPEKRRLGILFQDDLLFPHLSVAENLAFGLKEGLARSERQERVAFALLEAELPGLGGRDPLSLSGGQRARVALLRCLLSEPEALLLDEPFAKLDAPLRVRFRTLVLAKAAERGLPVLLVSHDPADAHAAGGPIVDLAQSIGPAGAKL